MDIPSHQTSLISLLSLCSVDIAFFSELNYFLACHMLFYFLIPPAFFLCNFCFVILSVCNFSFLLASCLFFISLFALFLNFHTGLLNFSPFISFLCSFDNKLHFFFLNHCTAFSFCLFPLIPCTFFPICMIYFLFSVTSLLLQNWWYWKILQGYMYIYIWEFFMVVVVFISSEF